MGSRAYIVVEAFQVGYGTEKRSNGALAPGWYIYLIGILMVGKI